MTKLHDPNNTSSPTADLDAKIAHCYANPQDIFEVLKSRCSAKTSHGVFTAYTRHSHAWPLFIQERLSNGSIYTVYATSF